MASVLDVARYIVDRLGPVSTWKLQKLVYYSQAWSLVWDDEPLFSAKVEAWANGPVVPALWRKHRGLFRVGPKDIAGDPSKLTASEKETIDAVCKYYGPIPSWELSAITHRERPWKDARVGIPSGERSSREITKQAMQEFYESIAAGS